MKEQLLLGMQHYNFLKHLQHLEFLGVWMFLMHGADIIPKVEISRAYGVTKQLTILTHQFLETREIL